LLPNWRWAAVSVTSVPKKGCDLVFILGGIVVSLEFRVDFVDVWK
jgi:hypothetical protein